LAACFCNEMALAIFSSCSVMVKESVSPFYCPTRVAPYQRASF
jgi:hypothetical protein